MKRYLPFLIVSAVGLLTLVGATTLYRAKQSPLATRLESQSSGAGPAHVLGPPDAPVTLEEFGDFECPPCGALAIPINQLERDYYPHLRVVFRHFPLVAHQHAIDAALAAEAAGKQGRFWEMHDLLYREQSVWRETPDPQTLFNSYAGMLGLNVERFQKDMASTELLTRIKSDQQEGMNLGVQSTPTILLNNRALPTTSVNPAGLRGAVDEAVKARPNS